MNNKQIAKFLVEEAMYNEQEVNNMTNYEIFDAWLKYQGIIGYTDIIIEKVESIFDVDIEY